jgi:hypothetical protein
MCWLIFFSATAIDAGGNPPTGDVEPQPAAGDNWASQPDEDAAIVDNADVKTMGTKKSEDKSSDDGTSIFLGLYNL